MCSIIKTRLPPGEMDHEHPLKYSTVLLKTMLAQRMMSILGRTYKGMMSREAVTPSLSCKMAVTKNTDTSKSLDDSPVSICETGSMKSCVC